MSIGVVVCGRFCPKSFLSPYFGANLHDFIRAPGFDVTGCTGWGATWFEVRLGHCRRFEGNPPWRSFRVVVKQHHSVWANPWESKYRHMDLIWIKKYRQLAAYLLTLDLSYVMTYVSCTVWNLTHELNRCVRNFPCSMMCRPMHEDRQCLVPPWSRAWWKAILHGTGKQSCMVHCNQVCSLWNGARLQYMCCKLCL